jgi:predicted ArsR family transcriptional regulator
MSDTRERILHTLLNQSQCSVYALATAVGINPISVRHHIARLEAEGLVTSQIERYGVGRPRHVYLLTEAGLEKFPTRYIRLMSRLLEQMKDSLPETIVNALFSKMAADLAANLAAEANLKNLSIEKRLDVIKNLLAEEGFTVEWERQADEVLFRGIRCPYFRISQEHPEVCLVDQQLLSHLLNVPAQKVRRILDSNAHCAYIIPLYFIDQETKK